MSGMAEVLAAWNFEREQGEGEWQRCPARAKPGWIKDAQETLDFLTAAGFGDVREVGCGFNDKLQDLAKRLMDEDVADSLEILDHLADGKLRLI